MGLLARVEKRASLENPSTTLANPDAWLVEALGGGTSNAGVAVNQNTALKLSVVWACVNVLSQDVAKLPFITYRRLPRGKEVARDHPVYRVLHHRANSQMSAYNLRRTLQAHVVTWGKAFAEIERNGAGDVIGLWPLLPDRTEVHRIGGRKIIVTKINGEDVSLAAEDVLHIPGLGFDGLRGYSVIGYAKEAIGAALAAEQYGASFFGNGARPGGVITRPDSISEEVQKRLRKSFESVHQGLSGAQRVAILDEGMDYKQIGVPPEDAQFISTRQFSIEDIVRFFRVPPHKVQHLLRSTFSNEENQERSYHTDALQAWLVNWEQEVQLALFGDDDEHFAEHNVEGMLRGDSAARAAFYQSGINNGWMSPNEARARENLNPVDGGDVYLVPLNLISLEQAGEPAPAPLRSEQRTERRASYIERHRLQSAHVKAFARVGKRIVAEERKAVAGIAETTLRAEGDFLEALRDFYERFEPSVREMFAPLLMTYAETIRGVIANELGREIPAEAYEAFAADYAGGMASRHVLKGRKQLERIIADTPPEDQAEAIRQRLEEWDTGNPNGSGTPRFEKLAALEAVRAMGALSKAAYAAGGVTTLVWRTVGDNCPYCNKLNGRTVGIRENFLNEGEVLDPETDDDAPMHIQANIGHAPAHAGCDCLVGPGQ